MPDHHAITADVRFDHAGAAALAAELRGAAELLSYQLGVRARAVEVAREHWRGAYRDRFNERFVTCVADGSLLVERLRQKAGELDAKAAEAKAEQARRDEARRDQHDRENRNIAERIWHGIVGG